MLLRWKSVKSIVIMQSPPYNDKLTWTFKLKFVWSGCDLVFLKFMEKIRDPVRSGPVNRIFCFDPVWSGPAWKNPIRSGTNWYPPGSHLCCNVVSRLSFKNILVSHLIIWNYLLIFIKTKLLLGTEYINRKLFFNSSFYIYWTLNSSWDMYKRE